MKKYQGEKGAGIKTENPQPASQAVDQQKAKKWNLTV